jgi:methylated-DNA-protein-cysteine methyltransferase related protein
VRSKAKKKTSRKTKVRASKTESAAIGSFFERVVKVLKQIPRSRVVTYGQVARLAGNSRASRQVAWILSSSSRRHNLPWFRVINSRGTISLPPGAGFEEQRRRLAAEGVKPDANGLYSLKERQWRK